MSRAKERDDEGAEVGGDTAILNMFPLGCDGGEIGGSVNGKYKENSLSGRMWQPQARPRFRSLEKRDMNSPFSEPRQLDNAGRFSFRSAVIESMATMIGSAA